MDNEKLIHEARELCERLRKYTYWCGSSSLASHDIHPLICDVAVDALTSVLDLLAAKDVEIEELQKTLAIIAESFALLTARSEKAEAENDKAAAFIRWIDDNFSRYMPKEYLDRLITLEGEYFKSRRAAPEKEGS